ncbi:MAG: DUF4281 domain-containing protein [Burkholderiales bacterium]|nr:DUF4281 domain-containing protein [Burkholderiales bacterium]
MSIDALFSLANTAALCAWLALALTPWRWHWSRGLAAAIAFGLALAYGALIAVFWTQGSGDFGSLAGVASLFQHRGLLLAGWIHYLAFDLLIGIWEREEAARIGLSRWVLLPCLVLTFMFGPLGWLSFLAVRHFALSTRPRLATAVA